MYMCNISLSLYIYIYIYKIGKDVRTEIGGIFPGLQFLVIAVFFWYQMLRPDAALVDVGERLSLSADLSDKAGFLFFFKIYSSVFSK